LPLEKSKSFVLRMKSTVFTSTRSQACFTLLQKVVEKAGYTFLHCDNHNFEIEAPLEYRFKASKHLNARLIKLNHGTELVVEVRNIGLELKLQRRNDKLEIELIRSFSQEIEQLNSRAGAA
jgi:hypothetical protein